MATIRINRQAAHSGQLPQVCICCGTPTQQFVRHEFRFEPTWLILLLTVFPKLWMFLSYETFNLNLPVCSSHTTRFKWPSIAGLVTAGVLFLLLIPIIALSVTGNADKLLIVIPIFLLVIVAYVVTRFTLLFSGPRVVQYSSGTLELAGVSEEFARHVSGHGGFQQAPQYPPQQVYTGNYGLTQAAYQNTYRPAAGPSNRTLWIVLAAVFGPLALLGLLAFGVLFSREYARFSEKRQFADMRADFRETMARDQIESQQRAAEFQRKRREAQARALSEPPPTTPSQPSASTPAPTFQAGEAVFFEAFSNWNKGTVVSQNGDTWVVKYVDRFGREQLETHSARNLVRSPPPGVTVADREAIVAAKTEPPSSDFTPASGAAEGVDFQPGDTAYFELFGKWHKAKIERKIGGAYVLSYYDENHKREITSARPVDQVKRTPPDGVAVIDGPASAAERGSGTPSPFDSQLRTREKPPGFAANEASLKKGVKIFAWWGSKWWDGEVVSSRKGEVLVHYDGWSSNSDEWLPVDRIRLRASASAEKK